VKIWRNLLKRRKIEEKENIFKKKNEKFEVKR